MNALLYTIADEFRAPALEIDVETPPPAKLVFTMPDDPEATRVFRLEPCCSPAVWRAYAYREQRAEGAR